MKVGLDPGHIALDGDPDPLRKGAQPPIFGHVCCGQTAGWIKIPLGVEVGLGQRHIMLDGDPAPPKKGHSPQFSAHVCCGQMAGWIKMPLGTKVVLGSGHIVLHGDPAPPPQKKGHSPNFRPMIIVAKRSPILATAEHLLLFINDIEDILCGTSVCMNLFV